MLSLKSLKHPVGVSGSSQSLGVVLSLKSLKQAPMGRIYIIRLGSCVIFEESQADGKIPENDSMLGSCVIFEESQARKDRLLMSSRLGSCVIFEESQARCSGILFT